MSTGPSEVEVDDEPPLQLFGMTSPLSSTKSLVVMTSSSPNKSRPVTSPSKLNIAASLACMMMPTTVSRLTSLNKPCVTSPTKPTCTSPSKPTRTMTSFGKLGNGFDSSCCCNEMNAGCSSKKNSSFDFDHEEFGRYT